MSEDRGALPAEAEADPFEEADEADEPGIGHNQPPDRSRDLLGRKGSPMRREVDKLWDQLKKGFEDQADRADDLDKWWNLYNCELDDNQYYNGNAQIYVPIIRDAVNARVTRNSNQLFPASGRYIDCVSSDGSMPSEVMALGNHYIKKAKFKTQVVKPLLRNGDIEGQYNLYVAWEEHNRQIVSRETHGVEDPETGEDLGGDDIEDVIPEDISFGCPAFEVLHDSDVLVMPATANSVEGALAQGGFACIVRRWSKAVVEEMVEEGEFRGDSMRDIEDAMVSHETLSGMADLPKALCRAVGIRAKGRHALVFEVWKMFPLNDAGNYSEGGTRRLCRVWLGIDRRAFGAKRNPFWNDRCPLLSCSVEKIAGSFKGKSQVEALAPMQYEANDAANEAADADHYGAMPIIARAPGDGNAPLILNLAAVWDVDPNKIKFMEFPDLTARATNRIARAMSAIFQSLSVNPSMLPQQSGTSGRSSQARVAQEQQVDLLTTAESVSVADEGILTPAVEWIFDLDHQFRDAELTVRAYGEMGVRAAMIDVPPLQNGTRYSFSWCGAEQAKMNVAMQQQGTAFINILRGMRQDLMAEGYDLRLGPLLERSSVNIFGPMTGALILVDRRRELTVPPDVEDMMMMEGHDVPVHPLDNDAEHLQKHMKAAQESGDPHGVIRVHIALHLTQLQAKNAAMVKAQMGGAMGVPGGAGPGVAGTPPGGARGGMPPRQGAQPVGPRLIKQQPGAVPPDQMARNGAVVMPRRA